MAQYIGTNGSITYNTTSTFGTFTSTTTSSSFTNWETVKPIPYVCCGVRRPKTNIRCKLPINHAEDYHLGNCAFGRSAWYDREPRQLELPVGDGQYWWEEYTFEKEKVNYKGFSLEDIFPDAKILLPAFDRGRRGQYQPCVVGVPTLNQAGSLVIHLTY